MMSKMTSTVVPAEMLEWLIVAIKTLHKEAAMANDKKPLDADTMFPILVWATVQSELPFMHSCIFFLRHFAVSDCQGEAAYFLTCCEAAISFVMKMPIPAEVEASCRNLDEIGESVHQSATSKPGLTGFAALVEIAEKTELGGSLRKLENALAGTELGLKLNTMAAVLGQADGSAAAGAAAVATAATAAVAKPAPTRPAAEGDLSGMGEWSREGEDQAMMQLGNWLGAQQAMEDTIDVLEQEGWMA